MKDYFGREIKVGDLVVYGKSDRKRPMNVGVVVELNPEDFEIKVVGHNKTKPGSLSFYKNQWDAVNDRIVILPDEYKDLLG